MLIKDLFLKEDYRILQGKPDLNIGDISINSNKINKDTTTLFVALRGQEFNGHDYIDKAIENGAKAILVSQDVPSLKNPDITVIRVEDTRQSLSKIAFNLHNNPQKDITVIGVTGTSGKTSTTIIIESILKSINIKTAVVGTINNRIGDKIIPVESTTSTTPDILELAKSFDYIKKQGVNTVVMEVSSHALELHRVDSLHFKTGVFTNLSLEHMDFHKNMDNYADAKFKLFSKSDNAVINADDEYGKKFLNKIKTSKLSYSTLDPKADLFADNISITPKGTSFDLHYNNNVYKDVFINLIGIFSVYNVLSAISAVLTLKVINIEAILKALQHIDPIRGRCEFIKNDKCNVIIDYAHKPDGLSKVLKTVASFTKGRLISVFGCGGNRDSVKRPIMGEISGRLAQYTIITSDNPRNEDPKAITDDIVKGIEKVTSNYEVIVDREKAIKTAIAMAGKDDTVLIAGKGHETYQEFENHRKIDFDDKAIAEKYL